MKIYYETKPGELQHGLYKKKKAKYIAKIPMGNNTYRYFYDADELAAYKESMNKNIDKSMQKRQTMLESGYERRKSNKDLAKAERIAAVKRDTQRRLESESKAKAVEQQRKERKRLAAREAYAQQQVSKEYQRELASNSKKNVYFGVKNVDNSRPHHFTFDEKTGKNVVVYDDVPKKKKKKNAKTFLKSVFD